ncbi:DUF309 domain-containing protein [Deinococcus cellulosilyticus]|uniref:DUF309 domain-containing protein n=1 Tax=Deinococcus cellulosilyticus (strain DSM 18568 / NBRC 106333 / KACC 11606 / 5516J-15) TaxID=1223518 RepID=A0A511N704_DEIC1|nr:DUF309 domain-containing protein [Deinococcus cellulosilyticus]GEM48600.1 hypothetical protein DC3_42350 [Deinococcus cellulosilyticus NBRC 106333 = KACC 11606]
MQERLKKGILLFNARQYWEAHEAWEELWMQATGDDRKALSVLILFAAAMHKRWVHGSLTHRNFHKAQRHLNEIPCLFEGINLCSLKETVWQALSDPEVTPEIPLD